MSETVMFQTQLSSIMEALSTAAMAEITKLVDEYSAFLRGELSRKKHDNEILMKKLKVVENRHRKRTSTIEHSGDGVGTVLRERLWNGGSLPHHTPQTNREHKPNRVFTQEGCSSEWSNGPAARVGLRTDETTVTDRTAEPVTIKQERLEEDGPGECGAPNELRMNAPERSTTSLVARQPHPTDQSCFEEDWGFQSTTPGGRDELTDSMEHNLEVEHRTMEHLELEYRTIEHLELEHRTLEHDLSSSSHCLDQDQPVVVEEIRLKREPESPCPDLNPLPGGEPGLEVDQGDLGQTYPEYAALNLGYSGYTDTSGLFFTYSSENQLQQHTSSSTTTTDDYASFPGKHSVTVIPGHHGDQRGNAGTVRTRAPLSKEKEGRFVCKHCGKGFPYISCLKRHALNHTRERTHHCSVCGRSFIRPSHLRRHELLHTGVRPFACALCGRHFSHGAHLRAHMKTHT
ncbi:zinc finger and SCAN domain-containing protein 23-like [Salmo trutta]|uniref:zinc finger and SCAN domain-containing protein 23-like n=1 Tax=Salmo trutta TaxID=8032 RepID=UPI00113192BF|nr:zinc finger and SCAN domain-containing protein 23-like [Salmo trutta]